MSGFSLHPELGTWWYGSVAPWGAHVITVRAEMVDPLRNVISPLRSFVPTL